MKNILLVLLIALGLSLCNLSERFKRSSSSGQSASGGSSRSVETANPTAEQTAALAGGQEVKWDKQGMSWTIPPGWTEETNESKMFVMRSPGGGNAASLLVNISPMDADFPADTSIQAFFDGAESRAKNGEVDEVKWVQIDGLKGVQFREAIPEKPDGHRRLQWMAYRKYTGQLQFVNVMLASEGKDFERHKNAMYGILYSMKVAH
ncbi:MAG TPA: hypothetical protein VJ656_07545 [Pyrinomonadaceae bacterium]|nr:hypothetical protein [Pyrinomonadaceae bacterium]